MQTAKKKIRLQWLSLAIISIIAIIIRVWLMPDWLNYDECQHFLVAKSPYWNDFIREFKLRAHPPFSYILMKPFVYFSTSAYAVKMLSLLSGITSIIIISFTLQRAGMAFWPSQIFTLFISMTPVFIEQSIEVRQYSICLVFVWLGLYFYFRFRKHLTYNFSVHIVIACVQFLVIMTEYSAIFHLLTLSIIIYAPLFIYFIRKKEWVKPFLFAIPQAVVFFLALILFRWHFFNIIPVYDHTSPYLFYGSLKSTHEVFDFFIENFPNFAQTILPNPWGMTLLTLLIFPFIPIWKNTEHAKQCRILSSYGIISVVLLFISALLTWFPFGGLPRHTVAVLPGITLACVLIIYMLLTDRIINKKYLVSIVAIICILLTPSYKKAYMNEVLDLPLKQRKIHKELFERSGFSEYNKLSDIIIANWQGRSVLTWWLFPNEYPQLIYHPQNKIPIYHYGKTKVIEVDEPDSILKITEMVAKSEGQCWIFLSFPKNAEEFNRVYDHLIKYFENTSNISLSLKRKTDLETIFIKVEKINPSNYLLRSNRPIY